jgi:hypothetical protein
MSHYMTALAMKQKGLKPATKIVLYWLADHHNGETGMCFPSLKTLSEECEMDVATVKRHLKHLEDVGMIQRQQRQRDNGSQTSTQYIIKIHENNLAQNAPAPSANCATPLAQNDTPLNLGNNNLGNITNISSSDDDRELEFFERVFWSRYPKKVGKKAAFKTFKRLMKEVDNGNLHYGKMVLGFEKYLKEIAGKDLQYVKHLATWLNGEHWKDGE